MYVEYAIQIGAQSLDFRKHVLLIKVIYFVHNSCLYKYNSICKNQETQIV